MLSQAKTQVIESPNTPYPIRIVAMNWDDYVWAPRKANVSKGGVRNEKEPNQTNPGKENQMLLSIQEVATRLSISKTGVYRLINSGQLRRIYIQGCARVDLRDLEELIERAHAEVSA